MSSLNTRIFWETLRSIDSATFTGAYQAIGTALAHSCCVVKFVNNSNRLITISIDGATDVDVVPAASFFLFDETANASREGGLYIPAGTQFYVKGAAGGTGLVYLVVQYPGQGG